MWEGWAERAGTAGALPLPAGGETPGRARGAPPPPPRRRAGWAGAWAAAGGRRGAAVLCSRLAGQAGGSDEYSEGEGEGRGLSARRGSLQPEPHDARRRQREPQKPGSERRTRGVGAACSAPRSPCAPRDASLPRQPRQAPPCGRRRRRRCHVPGEARGGRSGD